MSARVKARMPEVKSGGEGEFVRAHLPLLELQDKLLFCVGDATARETCQLGGTGQKEIQMECSAGNGNHSVGPNGFGRRDSKIEPRSYRWW